MNQNTTSNIFIWVIVALLVGILGGYFVAGTINKSPAPENKSSTTSSALEKNTATTGTDDWKIQNAMSAAPDKISKEATVLDRPAKEGDSFRELRKGTNTWTCIPDD